MYCNHRINSDVNFTIFIIRNAVTYLLVYHSANGFQTVNGMQISEYYSLLIQSLLSLP